MEKKKSRQRLFIVTAPFSRLNLPLWPSFESKALAQEKRALHTHVTNTKGEGGGTP